MKKPSNDVVMALLSVPSLGQLLLIFALSTPFYRAVIWYYAPFALIMGLVGSAYYF